KEGSHIEALQEVRVLRKLRHPCIVQFMDSFLSDDLEKLFIVMEYCDSGVLADRIKEAIQEQQWIKENKLSYLWLAQICYSLSSNFKCTYTVSKAGRLKVRHIKRSVG
ncbi:MAG: protein kinase domain-containing protein, partial [Henriciella sp.]